VTAGPSAGRRLMAVHAHPDDESSKGAATLARYAAEGADVLVCTLTGGERGSVLNPELDRPEITADLAAVRRREMDRARAALGVRQHFLGFVDSGFPGPGEPLPPGCFVLEPLARPVARLVAELRAFRPHALVTYDPNGSYPHPDHIRTHEVAMAAFAAAASPAYPNADGPPWPVPKLYYTRALSREWYAAIDAAMTAAGLLSGMAEILGDLPDVPSPWPVTTTVECAAWFPARRAALLAHATQVAATDYNVTCPVDLEQATWPTEDYHLARSRVPVTLPERDLFAGVPLAP
jgi:mycothiol S-conjugate amidase